ncbi:PorP/SprF family type IX secretion system membrane protein [Pedobacter frigoris]|uniref:PorP/SprF family type IX secretion system membrane protein n=1 Tax=Pedobacter frigoris TaxID=2571272 RepID=UPI00292F1D1C|nr:PorP/SprF family type IX secretion system membrane protein [Pedobacter frigoris]
MKTFTMIVFAVLLAMSGRAQLNPQGSQYFFNPYLGNPALAGVDKGWAVSGAISAQLTDFDGGPLIQSLTLAYGSGEGKVGAGLLCYKERAGVIGRTVVKIAYAYHLPLDYEESFLDLGLTGGFLNDRIDFDRVKGDLEDESLYDFNKRGSYLDGDFGIAFRNSVLTVQGSLPNLKRFLNREFREIADRYLYMAGASYHYRIYTAVETVVSPMLVYRGVQHEADIWDAGVNVGFQNGKLMGSVVYHSTGSITFGIGNIHEKKLSILAQYTNTTRDLKSYSNGQFEVAVKYSFR